MDERVSWTKFCTKDAPPEEVARFEHIMRKTRLEIEAQRRWDMARIPEEYQRTFETNAPWPPEPPRAA